LDPPCALRALFYCVASILGRQRCCKAFGRAFGRALAEPRTELRAELLQGFGRARCRAFAELWPELSVLKFVTWILPQLTARSLVLTN
jgi:hypothetical protein